MSQKLSPKTLAHRVGERWLFFFFVVALLGAIAGIWALLGRLSTPAQIMIVAPPTLGATPLPQATTPFVSAQSPDSITVMVAGAVQKPGLYQLPAQATALDAVTLAVGFSAQADQSALNLTEPLIDGAVLTIPTMADVANDSQTIPINRATLAELESLPGIGPATAQAIIDHRPYRRLSDLNDVPGIGEGTINRLRGLISFEN